MEKLFLKVLIFMIFQYAEKLKRHLCRRLEAKFMKRNKFGNFSKIYFQKKTTKVTPKNSGNV